MNLIHQILMILKRHQKILKIFQQLVKNIEIYLILKITCSMVTPGVETKIFQTFQN
jgi:hypothetical protein